MRGVTITYNNGHTALRDAGFCTPLGSITALVGVNGSSKSTLFKAIMGFLKPAAGTIQVVCQSTISWKFNARNIWILPNLMWPPALI